MFSFEFFKDFIINFIDQFIDVSLVYIYIEQYFIYFLLISLLIGILFLFFIPSNSLNFIKYYSLVLSFFIFFISFISWFFFVYFHDDNLFLFQFTSDLLWSEYFSFYFSLGLDGLSFFFLILTTFLTIFCILISWNSIIYRVKEFFILIFIIEFLLINVFCSLNLFFFYISFEAVLIPMFFLIGIWGSRQRKYHAVYMFFFYTLIGSIVMLLGLLFIYSSINSLDFRLLLISDFSLVRQKILWLVFFFAFAIKIPMIPFHIWLPEAHVEAPTAGSVILAGLLLKLGSYGILRFVIFLFPEASSFFTPLVFLISLIGIIYGSCTTIRQIDLKKIIAYSSVAHMNFVTLGLFSNTIEGIAGSIYLMLSHGLVSSGLFICIGYLYDRYKTRIIFYYGGLVWVMPFFTFFFFFLILANVSFPGTSSFVGEFLVLISLLDSNFFITFLATFSIILGAIYSFWLFNRLCFKTICLNNLKSFNDLSFREFFIIFVFVFLILVFGIFPNIILNFLELSLYNYYSLKSFNHNNIIFIS